MEQRGSDVERAESGSMCSSRKPGELSANIAEVLMAARTTASIMHQSHYG